MLIPTMGFWKTNCEPLLGLNITTWLEAVESGLITDHEGVTFVHITNGNKIPTEEEFKQLQYTKLDQLRAQTI